MNYAELCVTSNFTFLTGASHPEELVVRAASLGLSGIAITDRNSLAGVVRAYSALKELARKRDEALAVRSSHRTDPSSRQDIVEGVEDLKEPILSLPRLLVGCRLVLEDSPVDWVALPQDRPAYARLSRLLTKGKRRTEKGECQLFFKDLLEGARGVILMLCRKGHWMGNLFMSTSGK
nr:PHP domain-containing protein [Pseudovibrio denitrificans]